MPKAESADKESNHQYRRGEMKRVFESVSKSHNEGGESNLSVKEQNALKNLLMDPL